MIRGKVSKLVSTFGSTWGRIKLDDEAREIFFNPETLAEPADYGQFVLGQSVEFDEEIDRANGTRAVRVRRLLERASSN
jgi:cold shock CspA family protein